MSSAKTSLEIAALREAALEDLSDTPDEELRREAIEDGDDVAAVAESVRAGLHEAAAAALRARLAQAKARGRRAVTAGTAASGGLSLVRIQALIRQAFQRDQSLGLAFRDGVRQSEADWRSLYADLISLGAIKPDDSPG
jgi:hypothetical protein